MACLNMEWRDARDALLERRGGLDVLRERFAAGGDEALAEARQEIHPYLDSGPPPPSDLWGEKEDRDDPDVLAVERMRWPAAELGPNWAMARYCVTGACAHRRGGGRWRAGR